MPWSEESCHRATGQHAPGRDYHVAEGFHARE